MSKHSSTYIGVLLQAISTKIEAARTPALLWSSPTRSPEPEHRRLLDIILTWHAPAAPIGYRQQHDAIAAP